MAAYAQHDTTGHENSWCLRWEAFTLRADALHRMLIDGFFTEAPTTALLLHTTDARSATQDAQLALPIVTQHTPYPPLMTRFARLPQPRRVVCAAMFCSARITLFAIVQGHCLI